MSGHQPSQHLVATGGATATAAEACDLPCICIHVMRITSARCICKLCLDNLPIRIVVVIVVVVGQPPCGRMAAPIAASRRACIGIRSCDDLSSNNSPSLIIIITTER